MFAARDHQKEAIKGNPGRAEAAPGGKPAPEYNPTWQSLALNPLVIQPEMAVSRSAPLQRGSLQRECACGQRCDECQAGELGAAEDKGLTAPGLVGETLHSPGRPLDPDTGAFFEQRFGHDFGDVRVHDNARAAASADSLHAAAYTVGSDIVFAANSFSPATPRGRRLLAHELTHVVQQQKAGTPAIAQGASLTVSAPGDRAEREADHVADMINSSGVPPQIVERPSATLARASLDLDTISSDVQNLGAMTVPAILAPVPISLLFLKYNPHPSGEIAFAADYPTTFTVPADKTKPAGTLPKADAKPPLSNVPVEAHFFPTIWPSQRRALILGGFHGDERPGWQVAEAMIKELSSNSSNLAFNTIIVPRVNAAAIADDLAGVKLWRNRCNRQLVDLNRNFPTGGTPKDTDCPNTVDSKGVAAPVQPEVQGVMDVITKFKPDRILSMHAISDKTEAGVFADPNQNKDAVEMARGMASTLVNKSDRPHNRLGPGVNDFNPIYPHDKPGVVAGGTSLGAWGPTAVPGQTTPVITMEAPEFKSLGTGSGTDPRTVEGFMRPVRAFLGDPADLATAADRDILNDIDAFNAAESIAFLTGLLPQTNDIYSRIRLRVDTAIAKLNDMKPKSLPTITNISGLRLFAEDVGSNSAQAKIDFDKFFLVGGAKNGWDTLPDQFFKQPDRKGGVDRAAWLATPSKDRLDIILQYSSLPGTSRHHWGTEVDLNSVTVEQWKPPPAGSKPPADNLAALDTWLLANAGKVGLVQAYTSGPRPGGYNEEPWHYSYAPISVGLRQRYNRQVNLQTDVIDKIVAEFQKRATAAGQTVPTDFAAALKKINISDLVNKIGPGL